MGYTFDYMYLWKMLALWCSVYGLSNLKVAHLTSLVHAADQQFRLISKYTFLDCMVGQVLIEAAGLVLIATMTTYCQFLLMAWFYTCCVLIFQLKEFWVKTPYQYLRVKSVRFCACLHNTAAKITSHWFYHWYKVHVISWSSLTFLIHAYAKLCCDKYSWPNLHKSVEGWCLMLKNVSTSAISPLKKASALCRCGCQSPGARSEHMCS